MRVLAQIASGLALLGTIVPSVLFFAGALDLPRMKLWMLVATIVWFATAPLWMERRK